MVFDVPQSGDRADSRIHPGVGGPIGRPEMAAGSPQRAGGDGTYGRRPPRVSGLSAPG